MEASSRRCRDSIARYCSSLSLFLHPKRRERRGISFLNRDCMIHLSPDNNNKKPKQQQQQRREPFALSLSRIDPVTLVGWCIASAARHVTQSTGPRWRLEIRRSVV